jgi:hypothetical protein
MKRKLVLNRETLASLQSNDLEQVNGGTQVSESWSFSGGESRSISIFTVSFSRSRSVSWSNKG